MMRKDDEMQPGWGLKSFEAAAHLEAEETIRAYRRPHWKILRLGRYGLPWTT